MSKILRRRWEAVLDAGIPRRDRGPCSYEAYVPDPLAGRVLRLDAGVAADVADAEQAIARFDLEATALVDTEALARLLLRAEAVASSRIEGLELSGRRLLRAEAARALGEEPTDVTAAEILGNIDAMVWCALVAGAGGLLKVADITEIHRRLLAGTRLAVQAGRIRTEQNWIGGSSHNPCSAAFVPPPPEAVTPLLEDLASFCSGDDLPVLAQAAIAHAQFETIHPFADGNGRTGRALIHVILRRRGLVSRVLPPVSLVLATRARDYIEGLAATRYSGAASSRSAHEGLNRWIGLFAAACLRAVHDAVAFELRIKQIQDDWRRRIKPVRSKSATDLLIESLPGVPVLTVATAMDLTQRSFPAANEAVARLTAAGILLQVNGGRRNRAFEARDVIDAFTDLERQLASPDANTRSLAPVRPVPRGRLPAQRR